jgi:hypothetical protein
MSEERRLARASSPRGALLSGLGLGLGLAAFADLWPQLAATLEPLCAGSGGLALAACLAALTGFFFETSPPRSGSKDRKKDRIH